jgi:hypothetical protein
MSPVVLQTEAHLSIGNLVAISRSPVGREMEEDVDERQYGQFAACLANKRKVARRPVHLLNVSDLTWRACSCT